MSRVATQTESTFDVVLVRQLTTKIEDKRRLRLALDRMAREVDGQIADLEAQRRRLNGEPPADESQRHDATQPTVAIEGGHVIGLSNGGRCIHCGQHTERIRSHGYSCEEFRRQHCSSDPDDQVEHAERFDGQG